jgi:hypothetical protein
VNHLSINVTVKRTGAIGRPKFRRSEDGLEKLLITKKTVEPTASPHPLLHREAAVVGKENIEQRIIFRTTHQFGGCARTDVCKGEGERKRELK